MEKEHYFDGGNDIEDEENGMAVLPDSDINEMGNQSISINSNYESEVYR
jgi:hypothetical protein